MATLMRLKVESDQEFSNDLSTHRNVEHNTKNVVWWNIEESIYNLVSRRIYDSICFTLINCINELKMNKIEADQNFGRTFFFYTDRETLISKASEAVNHNISKRTRGNGIEQGISQDLNNY